MTMEQKQSIKTQLHSCRLIGLLAICFASFLLSMAFDRILLKNLYYFFVSLDPDGNALIHYLEHTEIFSWHRIYFFFICFFFMGHVLYWGKDTVFRFRYLFAASLLILLVLGKFSGSSLGFYDSMLTDNTVDYEKSTLLGTPQGIRGDEWATEKPYYFAQGSTDYSYFNENLMYGGCDMVVSAFAPVRNIIILARPDLWGFLFLPADYAFSFYWNVRIIFLFMASFELAYMLTKSKKYGIIWALFVSLAPPIQWWLSQVLMIIVWSGQYFIVVFYKLVDSKEWKHKLVWTLLAAWFGIIYIMTMYPASQVPMAYVFAVLFIYIIISNWNLKPFSRINLAFYGLAVSLVAGFMIYYLHMSGNAMNSLLNTNYPGKARSWLELQWDYELLQLVNPIIWLKPLKTINSCEASQCYSFLPFVIAALCFNANSLKNDNRKIFMLIYPLAIVCLFMWQLAYMPEIKWLATLTFMSFSYPVRILFAVNFGFMLILLLMLHYNETKSNGRKHAGINIFITYFIFSVIYSLSLKSDLLKEYFPEKNSYLFLFIAVALYSYMGFCIISGGNKVIKKFVIIFISISFFSTAFINPITYGTDSMFEKTTMKKIREINDLNPGRWMVSGNPTISNLVTAQGVARTTGTYYYPDIEMMEIIDPTHEYENMWNQYAHIDIRLIDGTTVISQYDYEQGYELPGVSKIIYVNLETAKKLEIKYIFTKFNVPESYLKAGYLTQLYANETDGWDIYVIN